MSEIREFVMQEPIFDNHEHQGGFSDIERRAKDLTYKEFVGYAHADLRTAMATGSVARGLQWNSDTEKLPDDEFFQLWASVRTTGYGQATEMACGEVLGIEFTRENADRITKALRAFCKGKAGSRIYEELLARAGVCGAVNDACWGSPTDLRFFTGKEHPASFGHALRYDDALVMTSRQPVDGLERILDVTIHRLGQFDDALDLLTDRAAEHGKLTAMKCGLPYQRDLTFENSSFAEAERAFEGVMQGRPGNARPLHDYLFHRFVQRAIERDLPIQFHTGYLAGNWGDLRRGRPDQLIPIFQRYQHARFDLFHAGWPDSELMGAIGKEFPNVWLDLCWAWTMSPVQMARILDEWLGAVPHNKIFGYGGDTGSPFCVPGYAGQARRGIAGVLERKVERGEYDLETAQGVARRIMHENAQEFYGLA